MKFAPLYELIIENEKPTVNEAGIIKKIADFVLDALALIFSKNTPKTGKVNADPEKTSLPEAINLISNEWNTNYGSTKTGEAQSTIPFKFDLVYDPKDTKYNFPDPQNKDLLIPKFIGIANIKFSKQYIESKTAVDPKTPIYDYKFDSSSPVTSAGITSTEGVTDYAKEGLALWTTNKKDIVKGLNSALKDIANKYTKLYGLTAMATEEKSITDKGGIAAIGWNGETIAKKGGGKKKPDAPAPVKTPAPTPTPNPTVAPTPQTKTPATPAPQGQGLKQKIEAVKPTPKAPVQK